ncbi:MAG: DUF4270 family protein [Bacteroidetes bacterium]|nr:DUF4270 family protein [Fibrella sp.]
MRSILFTTGLLLLAGWLGWGCQSGDADIGQDIITPSQFDIQYIDTVSVFTSTVVSPDTFITAGDTTLQIGRWRDALAGSTNAIGFGTPTYIPNALPDQADIVYDSLVLELPYAIVYGDTTQPFTVQAFRLIRPLESSRPYYNNSSVAYETTPFAQRTFLPQPRSGREAGRVRIRLSDEVGRQLYTRLRDRTIANGDEFRAFFPGFAFTGTSNANLFIDFSAARSSIALYYHQLATSTTPVALRFPFTGPRFNRVLNDFSGTPLQTLQTRADRVPSSATNRTTFLTTGPALRTRIDIPALAQLSLTPGYAGINGAQLVVQPIFRTQRDYFTVGLPVGRAPSVLRPAGLLALFETNNNNDLVAAVSPTLGSTTPTSATYGLTDQSSLELRDAYTFDLSQYVLQVLRRERPYRPLLVVYSAPGLNRLTIGDRLNATDPLRLRLFLTYTR